MSTCTKNAHAHTYTCSHVHTRHPSHSSFPTFFLASRRYQSLRTLCFSSSVRLPRASGQISNSLWRVKAAATETLKDSAKPNMGKYTCLSAAFLISSLAPSCSRPTTTASFSGNLKSGLFSNLSRVRGTYACRDICIILYIYVYACMCICAYAHICVRTISISASQ